MIIYHDHSCVPIVVSSRIPLGAVFFTYECRCGKLMIVERCKQTDTKVYGRKFFLNTVPTRTRQDKE